MLSSVRTKFLMFGIEFVALFAHRHLLFFVEIWHEMDAISCAHRQMLFFVEMGSKKFFSAVCAHRQKNISALKKDNVGKRNLC